ncbi:MAG: hypothetical protein F4047_15350 [Caldilineaceae bacterium SB0670_bin_27]|uniref:Neutral/alkaline non-lysosomal ceramidase N-terminal domain-containing protein n=1 Tax=Caldilineaceae bacterium SB0664_bin_27 TaxID=2605260 RepID=A0A6B0YSS9_9CHLR|nr:hypothetical protein [Caldilineaceae bacterium SB0664_bin_27]MYJ79485.1 hypothetical protein [Caldilineaceae bacterium SB0670_bin_27]
MKHAPSMLAGAAEAVITRVKDRPVVYDDLFARALVLGADDDRLVIVATDMGTLSVEFADNLLRRIERTTDIPSGNIIITTTQTHNAPGVDGREMTPEASEWLSDCIAGLVKRANDDLRPCVLNAGRAPVQIGYNRRLMQDGEVVMAPNPNGAIVPWVDVLEAKDADGRRIAVLFSHAAHPVIVHWLSEEIGPDFPGYAVRHLRDLLAREGEPEGVFMFAQACCGDINGHPLRGGFGACDAAGLSLAFAVKQALAGARPVTPGAFKARSLDLPLPLEEPPTAAECRAALAEDPDSTRFHELLAVAESGERQFHPLSMRALAVGDALCFLTFTAEMFAEYQLYAEAVSPFGQTFVFSHTNGITGYVATAEDYELGPAGGYESWRYPTRNPPWLPPLPQAERLVHEGITRLLDELSL